MNYINETDEKLSAFKINFSSFVGVSKIISFIIVMFSCLTLCGVESKKTDKIWPDVLNIDDFESGLSNWENTGTGEINIFSDRQRGNVLLWTADDDGLGHIVYKKLDRKEIDFSKYDIMMFDVKVSGKPIWNINPIIQQYPAIYGYRGLFYSIDTLEPFDKWYTYSQDLTKWENAWPDTYSKTNEEFQFEIYQLAGAKPTEVYLDNIRLIKNPLGVKSSVAGNWHRMPDGSQITYFKILLQNKKDTSIKVSASLDSDNPGTISKFNVDFDWQKVSLLPQESVELLVSISAAKNTIKKSSPYYGEMARICFEVDEIPGLKLFTELTAGTKPEKDIHPKILCLPDKAAELRKQYKDPAARAQMDKRFLAVVKDGEKILAEPRQYPPSAAPGRKKDLINKGALVKINVPNLPYNVYQEPESGRVYSGPDYDAGVLNYLQKHMDNGAAARKMGMAYLVTGDRRFAQAVAEILQKYTKLYPQLPKVPYPPASPVGSDCSGVTRIGGTFMRERVWLSDLAIALDCIRDSTEMTEFDVKKLTEYVFVPSGTDMMNHKVGVMNLQWMIDSAVFLAGMATDEPGLITRSLTDSHGVYNLMRIGFLKDGMWWENPSYQGVCKLAAYPIITTCLRNGIMKMTPELHKILLTSYKLNAPDEKSPTLGTGGARNFSFEDAGIIMMSEFLNDPETSWIIRNRKLSGGTYNCYPFALFGMAPAKMEKNKCISPIADETVNFPDYGGIAMRIPETDHYAYIHYGRELTHGHRNKLSINAYGEGGWFMRNVMGGYGHNFAGFLETIASANTIMVDGKNADADTGELLYQASEDDIEIISAREVGAWKDVEHERSVILTKGPMIVIDRCLSEKEHIYDWLYHANQCGGLKFTGKSSDIGLSKEFGTTSIYESLHPAGKITDGQNILFKRKDDSGVKIYLFGSGERFLFNVTDTFKASQGILWRKSGSDITFVSVFYPFKVAGHEIKVERLTVIGSDGDDVGVKSGQAYVIKAGQEKYTVLINYSGKKLTAGELSGSKRVMVLHSEI